MKVYAIKCPHCGAPLEYADNATVITCDYCDGKIEIERETPKRSAVQEGLDFERGRQLAQEEKERQIMEAERAAAEMREKQAQEEAQNARRRKNMFWIVCGWIFVPWVMGTVLFCQKCRWKWYWKLITVIGAYILLYLIVQLLG